LKRNVTARLKCFALALIALTTWQKCSLAQQYTDCLVYVESSCDDFMGANCLGDTCSGHNTECGVVDISDPGMSYFYADWRESEEGGDDYREGDFPQFCGHQYICKCNDAVQGEDGICSSRMTLESGLLGMYLPEITGDCPVPDECPPDECPPVECDP